VIPDHRTLFDKLAILNAEGSEMFAGVHSWYFECMLNTSLPPSRNTPKMNPQIKLLYELLVSCGSSLTFRGLLDVRLLRHPVPPNELIETDSVEVAGKARVELTMPKFVYAGDKFSADVVRFEIEFLVFYL